MIEKNCTFAELKEMGFADDFIELVTDKIKKSQYKRCLPPVPLINQGFIDKKGI